MSTHNLCFEQKYEKYQNFYQKNFSFLEVKFSTYLNRRVFIMMRFYTIFYHCLANLSLQYPMHILQYKNKSGFKELKFIMIHI